MLIVNDDDVDSDGHDNSNGCNEGKRRAAMTTPNYILYFCSAMHQTKMHECPYTSHIHNHHSNNCYGRKGEGRTWTTAELHIIHFQRILYTSG